MSRDNTAITEQLPATEPPTWTIPTKTSARTVPASVPCPGLGFCVNIWFIQLVLRIVHIPAELWSLNGGPNATPHSNLHHDVFNHHPPPPGICPHHNVLQSKSSPTNSGYLTHHSKLISPQLATNPPMPRSATYSQYLMNDIPRRTTNRRVINSLRHLRESTIPAPAIDLSSR